MLNLLLADSEIEPVPEAIASHPAVRLNAKKSRHAGAGRQKNKKSRSVILMDSTLHHSAMRKLPDFERRGRPDIAHFFLLLGLDSILNLEGLLRIYIHTRNDELITIDPATRLPRNYPRFIGLMESLFEKGAVPTPESPLLKIYPGYDLKKCLHTIPHSKVAVLSEKGKQAELSGYFKDTKDDLLCIIGGFSTGDFKSDVYSEASDVISISDRSLMVWTVTSEILVNYENAIENER